MPDKSNKGMNLSKWHNLNNSCLNRKLWCDCPVAKSTDWYHHRSYKCTIFCTVSTVYLYIRAVTFKAWNVKTCLTLKIFITLQSRIFSLVSNSVSFRETTKRVLLCDSTVIGRKLSNATRKFVVCSNVTNRRQVFCIVQHITLLAAGACHNCDTCDVWHLTFRVWHGIFRYVMESKGC